MWLKDILFVDKEEINERGWWEELDGGLTGDWSSDNWEGCRDHYLSLVSALDLHSSPLNAKAWASHDSWFQTTSCTIMWHYVALSSVPFWNPERWDIFPSYLKLLIIIGEHHPLHLGYTIKFLAKPLYKLSGYKANSMHPYGTSNAYFSSNIFSPTQQDALNQRRTSTQKQCYGRNFKLLTRWGWVAPTKTTSTTTKCDWSSCYLFLRIKNKQGKRR